MTNKKIRIAIVSSNYRPEISKSLSKHCLAALKQHGVERKQVTIFTVPGALEIPLVAKKLAKQGKYNAIIVFGAVYKGATYHFEQVANECVKGCMKVSYDYEIPVIFEVLAVYNPADAYERANGAKDNRGAEAARTALQMISLVNHCALKRTALEEGILEICFSARF